MTRFYYKAKDKYGILTSGEIEAENSKAVALKLEQLHYTPLSIKSAEETSGIGDKLAEYFVSFNKVKTEDIIIFTRQLNSILSAGIPLVEGLQAVAEQIKNKRLRGVVYDVIAQIEGGSKFSEALGQHKDIFGPLLINMVSAGEKAGMLDSVLDRVSILLEKEAETTAKIKTAMRYPLIVVSVLTIAFLIIVTFVIPRFMQFYGSFQTQLPLPTRILLGINYIIIHYWYWALAVIVLLIYISKRILDTEKGRYNWDRFVLSSPVFGPIFLKIYLSRFTRMLAAMLSSGITILEALTISADVVQNKVLGRVILDIRDKISSGKSLSEPMKNSRMFPPIAVSMVTIGEKSGELETMLLKTGEYFDRESDYSISNLTPMLEPILIFGVGLMVLVLALGVFLPMWDVVKIFKT